MAWWAETLRGNLCAWSENESENEAEAEGCMQGEVPGRDKEVSIEVSRLAPKRWAYQGHSRFCLGLSF